MRRAFDPSKVKVATFDLDGTVLSGGIMSDDVRSSLKRLSDMGIAVVVATGRDISQIPASVLECFSYLITNNGSHVCTRDSVTIYDNPIPVKTTVETLSRIKRCKGYCSLYLNGKVVATPAFLLRLLRRTEFLSKSHRKSTKEARKGNSMISFNLRSFIEKRNVGTYKIQSFFRSNEDALFALGKLNEKGDVESVLSHDICLETMAFGVSKANALKELCRHLGCTAQDAISFGDSANDMEIMKESGFCVAMGNAEPCVKEIADMVTENVAEDGVAKAIAGLFQA